MLITFASAQRFADLQNSPFSRNRAGSNFAQVDASRHPLIRAPLVRGFLSSQMDPKINTGNTGKGRSAGVLDSLATVFAGSEECVAVACVPDFQQKKIRLIIAANKTISDKKQKI